MNAEELTPEARQQLLALAREAIRCHLEGRPPNREPNPDPRLQQPAGAFVSLKRRPDRELRGCIGYIQADTPLAETVARAAVAAATQDPRFSPIGLEELASLALEVSVLEPPAPIRPECVEVGRHGLIVRYQSRSGLLLPQVPVSQGWDRETFLDFTCRKAGLPPDVWRKPGCELLAFTATVFGEE